MGTVIKDSSIEKLNINGDTVLNTETGEYFDISYKNLVELKKKEHIRINSKSYVYLDTEDLLALIEKGISQVELALLVTLSTNIMMGSNICMLDEDEPHTTKTIAKLVKESQQSVKNKINRLIKIGALYHGIMAEHKRLGKVYIINPHIIRKGVKLKESLGTLFNPIASNPISRTILKQLNSL